MDDPRFFECTLCGQCCQGFGGTYVTDTDVAAIAAFVGTSPETFVERYCAASGTRLVLAQKDDGFCVFWDDLCTIHPVKPRMCRLWPAVRAVIADPENWRIMARQCPGIRADADPAEVVRAVTKALAASKG